jgi:hypothetical protein
MVTWLGFAIVLLFFCSIISVITLVFDMIKLFIIKMFQMVSNCSIVYIFFPSYHEQGERISATTQQQYILSSVWLYQALKEFSGKGMLFLALYIGQSCNTSP